MNPLCIHRKSFNVLKLHLNTKTRYLKYKIKLFNSKQCCFTVFFREKYLGLLICLPCEM